VRLWRVLPLDPRAKPREPGGALWFPRRFQGAGRHDNPELYGCLYVTEEPAAAVAEALAPFRGSGNLSPAMLERAGRTLALAPIDAPDDASLVDLDEPRMLRAERLRPSMVATRRRTPTQEYATRLFEKHEEAAGLRWWSTLESSWINVTLFDRAKRLRAGAAERLTVEHDAVADAAELLGLA
jgi:RES domain-containing protein